MTKKIVLKYYTLTELAQMYGVCRRTFKKWINPFLTEIGDRNGRFYTIKQVKIIFEKLELPSDCELEEVHKVE